MKLAQVQPKIFSFDVFDTCVTRRFAYPRDLFFELGLRLAPTGLSSEQANVFAKKFQALRIRAEKWTSRRDWPHRSPDIYEIYRGLCLPNGCTKSHDEILETEIALEIESIYAIPKALAMIAQARKAGSKIIFVSDMYLPVKVLAPILKNLGVMAADDALYVSCDVKRSKRSGELFKHVIATEAVLPAQIAHFGDNFHADVLMARKAGLSATHFRDALLTEYERRIAGKNISRRADASCIAGFSRMSRLNFARNEEETQHELDPLIHSTIAPFLVAYVLWVLEQARATGIKRLYFVARDGQIFYKIAMQLMGSDSDIELRYLYGSRSAWFSASISKKSNEVERFLAPKGQFNSCLHILSRAGLTLDAQETLFNRLNISKEDRGEHLYPDQAALFVKRVLSDREAADLIFTCTQHARDLVLKYFSQEGLLDGTPWALVDVGWSLNSQAALKRIISNAIGNDFPVTGYYIGISKDHLGVEDVGNARSFLPGVGSLLTRRRVVIEHCFTPATHTTTCGYATDREVVVPLFGTEFRGATELEYASRLQDIAQEFANIIQKDHALREKFALNSRNTVKAAEDFISNPAARDAKSLSALGTVADMRHEGSHIQPLCGPMNFRHVLARIALTFFPKITVGVRDFVWLEGSRAISPFYIRIPISAMLWLDAMLNRFKQR